MSAKVEQAVEGLRAMIASGRLRPGDRLPSEADLCERLDVSRSSLREAQKMLAVAGVLISRTGSGTYVSALSADDFMSGLRIAVPLLPLEQFLELLDLRCVLEGHAAAAAAASFDDARRHRLLELAAKIAAQPWDADAEGLDDAFHRLLADGTDNASLRTLLAIIRERSHHYRLLDGASGAELKRSSDEAHRRIAEAVLARDPEAARVEAQQHVMTTRRWLASMRPDPEP
ncbi:GntR family transcriptional regulator [Brachybacterium huguangmaarense]|uniref:GntR family transcriptional regulator n=1 Tax=Brachybacterium huguangmaarense TaxID=1652028 RepID=A0ABY6G2U4_9MICO|nr:GntR family transcriptional regulator [Brachybacterium huguangmaarense]UYG16954.1 GntR family transcriptional regulator [Brachybacterium huguangmaarense]